VNPFEEVRRQPEPAPSVNAESTPAAAPSSAQAPFGDPAKMRLEEIAPLQHRGPATGGNPESLRSAVSLHLSYALPCSETTTTYTIVLQQFQKCLPALPRLVFRVTGAV